MKIGIAQINTIVGDIDGNLKKISEAYATLCAQGAEIIVYPELAICGYPPRDLLQKSRFVSDTEEALQIFAAQTNDTPAILGFVEKHPHIHDRFYNAAAWCESGKVQATGHKCLIPSYDVFDEDRYFLSADKPLVYHYKDYKIGITICEDIWYHPLVETSQHYAFDPIQHLENESLDLVLNLSASPWHQGKNQFRYQLLNDLASRCQCDVVYCNLIGGNDELIFDGGSTLINSHGQILGALPAFKEEVVIIDTCTKHSTIAHNYAQDDIANIHDALVLGLRDYVQKTGFERVVLGISGGLDSAVTAALATRALGKDNVMGICLPSMHSSQHSLDDAQALAEALGIEHHTLPIADIVNTTEQALEPLFQNTESDVTEENLQARARGLLLMALSNKFNALLLSTGNKSELAVGYCTLYGDMCGGLAVIADVPKSKVYELALYINRNTSLIPENTIKKPPSAELRPDQTDQDSLPPYDVLDTLLHLYVGKGLSSQEIINAGYDAATVHDIIRKVDLNEHKRKQAAPGLKISQLAFGTGRRIPIVQKYVS